jgi:16S rRNA processing protein RimM
MMSNRKICVGQIVGTHGVRGLVRLRSFMEDPQSIINHNQLTDDSGDRTFIVKLKSTVKEHFIAAIEGTDSRESAEILCGTKLYIPRSALPKSDDETPYQIDLIGLMARDKNNEVYGTVIAVHDYGAGPFLEIQPPVAPVQSVLSNSRPAKKNGQGSRDRSFMLPFTNACVPHIDLEAGYVVIEVPEGWL